MRAVRFLAGYYRITATDGWANVKKASEGEHRGKWVVDIRNNSGALVQYAGVWNTKREAIDEAISVLNRHFNTVEKL